MAEEIVSTVLEANEWSLRFQATSVCLHWWNVSLLLVPIPLGAGFRKRSAACK